MKCMSFDAMAMELVKWNKNLNGVSLLDTQLHGRELELARHPALKEPVGLLLMILEE